VGESTRALTLTASWRAAGYALGRLLVASGQGSGYLKGDIAEIVVCLGVVEAGRRQAVEEYLARRYFAKERSNFRYTGHYYHGKSGLHLAPYRAYDAKHGVWLSEDPLENAELIEGPNLYAYVGNRPFSSIDPLGLNDAAYFADEAVRLSPVARAAIENHPMATAARGASLCLFGGAAALAVRATAARVAAAGVYVLKNAEVTGPSMKPNPGQGGARTGTLCQVKWRRTPVFRLDYGKIPGHPGALLHYHVWPDMTQHHIIE
jgi:RHS repeat-associated protein